MLEVKTFDGFGVSRDGNIYLSSMMPSCRDLFTFLLMNGNKSIRREKLIFMYYPDCSTSQASKAFNTLLQRIKRWMDNSKISQSKIITSSGDVICEVGNDIWLDAVHFNELYCSIKKHDEFDLRKAEQAVSVYDGPFLSGIDRDWIYFEREKYHGMYVQLLLDIAYTHCQRKQYTRAINSAKSILNIDPMREYVHQLLIVCFCLSGQRNNAIKQYKSYVKILDEELGIEPMNEMSELVKKITTGERVSLNSISI